MGGVGFDPGEQTEQVYYWGLRQETNNMGEALSLYLGLCLIKDKGISLVVVIGDSSVVVKAMHLGIKDDTTKLKNLMTRIKHLASSLVVSYYHVLRSHNGTAGELENIGVALEQAIVDLKVGGTTYISIPW